jgi:hypothetical protein
MILSEEWSSKVEVGSRQDFMRRGARLLILRVERILEERRSSTVDSESRESREDFGREEELD